MTRRPRLWRRRRRVCCVATAVALVAVLAPAGLHAPAGSVERPEPVLRFEKLGLPDPSLLARLICIESGGRAEAVGSRGELGPCQMMPATARALGLDPDRLCEWDYATLHGGRWLQTLITRYGSVDTALRAWNAGETRRDLWHTPTVSRYVEKITGGNLATQ